ncbi:MAG: winged helix-turn-helix domain-containing protein [Candidatus Hodarchaeales archaeon]|jgi:DNA-binding MarR family transcriptional regulator
MSVQKFDKKAVTKTKRAKKPIIADISDPRLSNIDNPTDLQVLEVLSQRGGMTRGDLVRLTKIPRSTLYDSLTRLQLAGLVNKFAKKSKTGPGRPLVMFESIFNTGDR